MLSNQTIIPYLCRRIFSSEFQIVFYLVIYLDLSDAYLQVQVDEESSKLITINTHKGLYRLNRLSPGVKSAPGAFQQIMDTMLSGLPHVAPYLDDILVGGATYEEHKRNLNHVLHRLKEYGFTVKFEKCKFFMHQVKYLGQLLDKDGRTLRQPLDELLKESSSFEWSEACQISFDRFKTILQSPIMLTHYNPRLDIVVSADASNIGQRGSYSTSISRRDRESYLPCIMKLDSSRNEIQPDQKRSIGSCVRSY